MSRRTKILAIMIVGIVALAIGFSSIALADNPESDNGNTTSLCNRIHQWHCCDPELTKEECMQQQVDNGTITQEQADAILERMESGEFASGLKPYGLHCCDPELAKEECMQQQVDDGTITQEQADEILEQMEQAEGPHFGHHGMHQRGFGQGNAMEHGEFGPHGGFSKM